MHCHIQAGLRACQVAFPGFIAMLCLQRRADGNCSSHWPGLPDADVQATIQSTWRPAPARHRCPRQAPCKGVQVQQPCRHTDKHTHSCCSLLPTSSVHNIDCTNRHPKKDFKLLKTAIAWPTSLAPPTQPTKGAYKGGKETCVPAVLAHGKCATILQTAQLWCRAVPD